MTHHIFPIAALLFSSACLLFAGGINALILPVRGVHEGFSEVSLGLIGTAWALGYVLGCLFVPRLVARVGHIRSFSVMAALAAIAILVSLLIIAPQAWLPLRAISGFCFAGAAMIVESWLNERSDVGIRGRVFGIYAMVNLVATTAGQMVLGLGNELGYLWFVLAAIFYVLALVPTAVSSSVTPLPLLQTRLDIAKLWRNSPVAVAAAFAIGIANNAFATLAAVYARGDGLSLQDVALFASVPILAGAAAQIPIGVLSDRMDRRAVLVGVSLLAFAADLVFIFSPPQGRLGLMLAAAAFGACIYTMYPLVIAHAGDAATSGSYLHISGGLLMLFGIGAIVGPLLAGLLMQSYDRSGLFLTTAAAHAAIALFAAWRMTRRHAVPDADKVPFVVVPMPRTTTPQTLTLAPGVAEEVRSGNRAS